MNKETLPSITKLYLKLSRMASVITLFFILAAATAHIDKNRNDQPPMNNDGSFQEDFQKLNTEVYKATDKSFASTSSENQNESIKRKVRNAIPNPQLKWPNGIIPYLIDESLEYYRPVILQAIEDFHTKTCIRFVPRIFERNYVKISAGEECFSSVGMIGGQQHINLGQACLKKGSIIHELGHVVGFYEAQDRSDRDDYIYILWGNIQDGKASKFVKLKPYENLLLEEFDYNSALLDGNLHFSKDGKSFTMEAVNGQKLYETYEKAGLSETDVSAIKKLYNC